MYAGIGEPIYFYVETVFLWNGIGVGILYVFGTYLRLALTVGRFNKLVPRSIGPYNPLSLTR